MTTQIENSTYSAKLINGNIFHIVYKSGTTSTVHQLLSAYRSYLRLGKGKKLKVLIEVENQAYFDIEANECIIQEKLLPIAEAIVTSSLAIRLLVDYYLYSRKNNHEVRIFKSTEQAVDWLDQLNK